MQQRSVTGDFRAFFNKSALARGGLFLCLGVLVYTLLSLRQAYPIYFAVIFVCLILSLLLQARFYGTGSKQKIKDIALSWGIMMAVIFCEIVLVICGTNGATLRYAAFGHFAIEGIGLVAAVVCLLCIAEKKHLTAKRVITFNFSLAVLATSVCILSMLHSMAIEKLWAEYALMEGGIIVIGTLGAVIPLFQLKRKDK